MMEGVLLDAVRTALLTALLIAAPILGAGLVVGLLVSLLQAVTQVQEQTLSFLPRLVVMALVTLLLLGWITTRLADFALEMFLAG